MDNIATDSTQPPRPPSALTPVGNVRPLYLYIYSIKCTRRRRQRRSQQVGVELEPGGTVRALRRPQHDELLCPVHTKAPPADCADNDGVGGVGADITCLPCIMHKRSVWRTHTRARGHGLCRRRGQIDYLCSANNVHRNMCA